MTIPWKESQEKRVAKPDPDEAPEKGARDALLDRLKRQPVTRIGRWKRDELYDDAR